MATLEYDPITGQVKRRTTGLVPDAGGVPDFDPRAGVAPPAEVAATSGSPTAGTQSLIAQLGIPGVEPDFGAIINSMVRPLATDLGAQSVSDKAQRDAMIQKLLIQFGSVPEFGAAAGALGLSGDELGQIANAETRTLAEKNTAEGLSTTARLQKERDRTMQALRDALAGRGILNRGTFGIGSGEIQQDFKEAQADAVTQLMNYVTEFQRGFTEAERMRQGELRQARTEAARNIPPEQAQRSAAATATLVDYDGAGKPVYQTADGRTFTISPDGNPVPYTPVAAEAPVPLDPRAAVGVGSRSYVTQ